MDNWDQIYGDLKRRGWIICLILASFGYFFMSRSFTLGIILGGILIIANFSFLQASIGKAFQHNQLTKGRKSSLITKSFLRLFFSGGIIFVIIKYDLADPIGLTVGLSIVVLSIVSFGIGMAYKTRNWRVF